jgi:hypothetical protein
MKFSMPGWWELKLKVDGASGVDEITFNTIISSQPTSQTAARSDIQR